LEPDDLRLSGFTRGSKKKKKKQGKENTPKSGARPISGSWINGVSEGRRTRFVIFSIPEKIKKKQILDKSPVDRLGAITFLDLVQQNQRAQRTAGKGVGATLTGPTGRYCWVGGVEESETRP